MEAAERAKLETDVATVRSGLEEAMRVAVKEWEDVAARLGEADALVSAHLVHLDKTDQQLHWKRVTSRDSGLLGADWSGARTELREMILGSRAKESGAATAAAREELQRELFGERPDSGAEVRRLMLSARNSVGTASVSDWAWSVAALVIAIMLAVVLYRFSRTRGMRLARDIETAYLDSQAEPFSLGSRLSARLNLMGLNLLGDLAIPLLVAAALLPGAWRMVDEDTPRRLVAALLVCLAGAIVLLRLVHHLFEAYSPPHRPIPCSDAVARHYRWWLSAMIVLSVVALPVPWLLQLANLGPALRNVIVEVYKAGLLVMLLLFLVRKERVLGLGDVGKLHWGLMLAWITYPVAVISVAVLLVLQVAGFGVLVTFVGTGLLATVGIVLVAAASTEYLADVIDQHYQPQAPRGAGGPAEAGDTGSGAAGIEESRTYYIVALLRWLLRLAGLVVALLLILEAWNVPLRSEWLAWREVGLGGLAILVALVLDRIVFTALFTLYRSGRLPESTARMIRRWIRGGLAAVVGLTLIALAGFKIDSIWTFLTALLAMMGIGFVAVWSILSNILATLVILIWRPFNIGERIEILPEALEGQVVDINFIYTILKSEEGARISVPNNLFAQRFIRRHGVGGAPKRTLAEQLESEQPLEE